MTLQGKTFAFLAVFTALLALEWLSFVDHERKLLAEEYVERAGILARTLAELSREPLASSRITRLESQLESMKREKDVAWARVVNGSFRVIADTRPGEEGWIHSGPIASSAETLFESGLLLSRAPIEIESALAGMAEIAFSLDSMREKIDRNRIIFVEILAFQLAAGALLSALLMRTIVNPLRSLSRAVTSLSPREERDAIPVPPSSSVEIESVIAAVNGMRSRLLEVQGRMIDEARFAAMGKVAANMAHEIRNPLEAISGAVELIGAGERDGERGKYLAIIREEIGNLNEYLGEFLEFTRAEPTRAEPTDLCGLLDDVLVLMRPVARKAGMEIRNASPGRPVVCGVDRNQIKRVVLNLILNGIEAGRPGGLVEASAARRDGLCSIVVRDDGRGISADIAARAFEPYFSTKASGTGIGLPICKRLVEQHGGAIRIEGAEGGGTIVVVELPAPREQ